MPFVDALRNATTVAETVSAVPSLSSFDDRTAVQSAKKEARRVR
jgi:hypothetical protein